MPFHDALSEFCDGYFRAGDARGRIAAVHRFRANLAAPTAETDPASLWRALEMLLQYARRDTAEGRTEAAGLARDLWERLAGTARQRLFHDGTLLLLEHAPALADVEERTIRAAIHYGCELADAGEVERLCRELTERQISRSLGLPPTPGTWRGAAAPPPDMEVLRLVARHAPARVWPHLVCDLWRLYNLDLERAESLARDAGLALSGERARVMVRRCARGTAERLELCWDLAKRLLERTLREARESDLRAAAPGFLSWLRSLTGMPEIDRIPLLPLLAAWATPSVLPVLQRWSRETRSAEFQRQVQHALRDLRSALGLGPEVTPARAPKGTGREPIPTNSPTVINEDVQDVQDGGSGRI